MLKEACNTPSSNESKSKRIFSNTLLLFIRMLFIMIITLYTVRVVLNNLGELDFGLFNTIAGVILISTFVSQTLALAVQRFYSYALGDSTESSLLDIFNVSSIIVLLLSLVAIILFETIGLWFVNTQLTIPTEKMVEVNWLFHFSLATFILMLLQIPYTAAIFAHEDMSIYAVVSAIDCLLKLIVALLITTASGSRLVFYGAGLLIISCITTLSYAIIAHKRYSECRFKRVQNRTIASKLLAFSGWTMYGNVSGVAMIQGSHILLNIFFGPLINAAFGIGNQLYNALNALGNTVVISFRPAMIKSYAEQQYNYLNNLFYTHNKAVFYLLTGVSIPLLFEMRPILEWWLKIVSDEMVLFSRLFVVYLILLIMSNPITTIIQATGKIKYYSLVVESITILCLPISWVCFRMGYNSVWLLYNMIGVCVVTHFGRIYFLKLYYPSFSARQYVFGFVLPAIICVSVSGIATYMLHQTLSAGLLRLCTICILSPLVLFISAYFIGINHAEKAVFHNLIRLKLR